MCLSNKFFFPDLIWSNIDNNLMIHIINKVSVDQWPSKVCWVLTKHRPTLAGTHLAIERKDLSDIMKIPRFLGILMFSKSWSANDQRHPLHQVQREKAFNWERMCDKYIVWDKSGQYQTPCYRSSCDIDDLSHTRVICSLRVWFNIHISRCHCSTDSFQ